MNSIINGINQTIAALFPLPFKFNKFSGVSIFNGRRPRFKFIVNAKRRKKDMK